MSGIIIVTGVAVYYILDRLWDHRETMAGKRCDCDDEPLRLRIQELEDEVAELEAEAEPTAPDTAQTTAGTRGSDDGRE